MSEEKSREQVEEIINNVEPIEEEFMGVSRDPLDGRDKVPSSPINEEIKEEIKEEEIKPKAKAKSKPRAKPKIKIVKESVEPVEPIVENVEPQIEEKPEPPKQNKLLNALIAD